MYKEHRLTHIDDGDVLEAIVPPSPPPPEDNAFLFSENARTLSFETASSLTDDAAVEAFAAIRWSDGPRCVNCGSTHLYQRRTRGTWKCADCVTEFSSTSRTVFDSHKMMHKRMLIAIAVTVGASQVRTLSEASHQIGITSKSAFAFIDRLRRAAKLEPLRDEVKEPIFEAGKPRYMGGLLLSTRTWWTPPEKEALVRFVDGGYSPDEAAVALGRTAKSIANYTREIGGVHLPPEWQALIAGRRPAADPRIQLAYPYISKVRPEHADILALNALVPRAFPDAMRADICQEMMLAVLEGRVTIDDVKANRSSSAWFFRKFYKENHEQSGRAISLDAVAFDGDDRSNYDVISSVSAKEWWGEQVSERQRFFTAYDSIGAPTQIDDVYRMQIARVQRGASSMMGVPLSFGEAVDLVEREDFRLPREEGTDYRSHSLQRAEQRYGVRLNRRNIREIIDTIESGNAVRVRDQNDDISELEVPFGRMTLNIIYRWSSRTIITMLPPKIAGS